MSFGQTMLTPPLPKASYIILYYPRSEVCGQGYTRTVACNCGLFPTWRYLCQQVSNMIFDYMIALFICVDRTVSCFHAGNKCIGHIGDQ